MIATPAVFARSLCAVLLASAGAFAQSPPTTLASGIDRNAIDPAVRVQDDLFRHANGKWLRNTTIPPDKASVGADEEMAERTQAQLRGLIEAAQRQPDGDAEVARIGDLYASFMDEAAIEKLGTRPLAAELAAIDAIGDQKQLLSVMARVGRLGADMPIGLGIVQDDRDSTRYVPRLYQDGLGLPDRDYYLKTDDARFKAAREQYLIYLSRLLALAGERDTEASARQVLALETALARAQWTRVENRDPVKTYNRVDLAGLPKLAPTLDWDALLAGLALTGKTPDVLVTQPSYLTGLDTLLKTTPLATWKAYVRSHLLNAYAPYLGKAFVDARFAFVGTALQGTTRNRPRWKRGITLVDDSIGEGLGKVYVAKFFPPEYKARTEAMVANLLAAYRESIETLDWMGAETKKAAQAKLAKFNTKIGYPKRWIDYSTLEIRRGDLGGNVMRARAFEYARNLAKLGRPIDRDEWGMTPQTINAYYDPSLNEIVFPAAFLQPPEFNPKADDAVNYGAVGAVIGHEISHGFDDEGSQYDGDGNLREWWTAEDTRRFAAKTHALVAQYSAFMALPGYPVNGELTLGENIADNSGLAIAYKAYHLSLAGKPAPVIDGMSGDARFFYGYAQAWRAKQRDASVLEQIKSDPHAPDAFRVIGAARNQPGFYATFGVKPGDRMYLPPEQRVSIW